LLPQDTFGHVGALRGILNVGSLLIFWLGGMTLLAGPLVAAMGGWDRIRERVIRNVRVARTGELRAAFALPRRVVVRGATTTGPAGPLRAPLSGTPCVWYRLQLWRSDERITETTNVSDSYLWQYATADTVVIDDGGGPVLVSAALLARPLTDTTKGSMEQVPDGTAVVAGNDRAWYRRDARVAALVDNGMLAERLPATERSTLKFTMTEEIVRPDRMVTVVGRPRRSGRDVTLVRGHGPVDGATDLTVEELHTYYGASATDWWGITRFAVICGGLLCLCAVGGRWLVGLPWPA
jgi:hypothetical protein